MIIRLIVALILSALTATSAIADDIYRWTDPESGKVLASPKPPSYPIKEKRKAGRLPNGDMVELILDSNAPEVKALIEKRKVREAEEKRIAEEQARQMAVREAEEKRIAEEQEKQAGPIDFGDSPEAKLIKVKAIIESLEVDGRDCEWALKVDNQLHKCITFLPKMVEGAEWTQAIAAIQNLLKDEAFYIEHKFEFLSLKRSLERIAGYSQFAQVRLGRAR